MNYSKIILFPNIDFVSNENININKQFNVVQIKCILCLTIIGIFPGLTFNENYSASEYYLKVLFE